MSKRVTAFLLCVTLLLSLLSGCGGQSPEEQTAPAAEEVKLPEDFTTALSRALILLTESEHCFVRGVKALLEDELPVQLGSRLYIPAATVAESLGGSVLRGEGTLTVSFGDITIEITDGTNLVVVNGAEKEFAAGAAFTEKGVLVPAEEYCEALGTELHRRNDLILIGNDLEPGLNAASEEEANLVFTAMASALSPVGAIPAEDTYIGRVDSAYTLTIDPLNYPFSTEQDTLVAVAGCLYVENLSVDYVPDREAFTVKMTVYNYLGYCYGSVEVYDSSDQLKELERIMPYGGQKSSVVSSLTDVAQLAMDTGKAVWNLDLDYLTYRTDLNSAKTDIEVEVPKDGYIYITCNPAQSDYVALYDMVYAFVNTAVCLSDIGDAVVGKKDQGSDAVNKVVEYILDQLKDDPGLAVEMAAEFANIFANREYSFLDFYENSKALAADLLDAFRRVEIDILGILKDGINAQLSGALDKGAEAVLTALLPMTEMALDTWQISTGTANLVNTFLDMTSVLNCSSLIVDFSDWRTAYCEKLSGWMGSGDRFALAYLDGDNIPELLILHAGGRIGSSARVFTYRNRQVVSISSHYGEEIPMGYGEMYYLPYKGTIVQGNSYEGITFIDCLVLKDGSFQLESTFEDDAMAKGGEGFIVYKYNGFPVTEGRYHWELHQLGIFPEGEVVDEKWPIPTEWIMERAQIISAYTSGWNISQANLEQIYSFVQ